MDRFYFVLACLIFDTMQALTFRKCEKLIVRDLRVRDAQQIQVSFDRCNHVRASNLNVTAPGHSPNTDGIHVTHSTHIAISNCFIATGDDCISIVSGSRTVRATHITCGPGHGIRYVIFPLLLLNCYFVI